MIVRFSLITALAATAIRSPRMLHLLCHLRRRQRRSLRAQPRAH